MIICKCCSESKPEEEYELRKPGPHPRYRRVCKECRRKQYNDRVKGTGGVSTKKAPAVPVKRTLPSVEESENGEQDVFKAIVNSLIEHVKYDGEYLKEIHSSNFQLTEEQYEYCSANNITFDQLKNAAKEELSRFMGLNYPHEMRLEEGTYLIVGDSHGWRTKRTTFDIIKNICKAYKLKAVVHLGHIVDEHNNLSHCWRDLTDPDTVREEERKDPSLRGSRERESHVAPLDKPMKVIVLPKIGEIQYLIKNNDEYKFDIVRERLFTPFLDIKNQNVFNNEYDAQPLSNLNQNIFMRNIITNFHKHEIVSRGTLAGESLLYIGLGCICEKFTSGILAKKDKFSGTETQRLLKTTNLYQRRTEFQKLWEKGLMLLTVDSKGEWSACMSRIQETDTGEQGVSFFNTIVTDKCVYDPEEQALITGDMHIPMHEPRIMAIINKIVEKYGPFDYHINLGDVCHNQAVNHHVIESGKIGEYANTSVLNDAAYTHQILKKTLEWTKGGRNQYLLLANHERFLKDYYTKMPPFSELLNVEFLFNTDKLGVKTVPNLSFIQVMGSNYTHGNLKAFSVVGRTPDKMAKLFKSYLVPVSIGHVHFPSIRSGCYSIGLCGKLDQNYNETNGSNWLHGFGIATRFRNTTWVTTIPIMFDTLLFDGRRIAVTQEDIDYWTMKEYKASISYSCK